ncbi:TRAP transporter substrate-binding protein DctP [Halalkalibacillus halophilus]|uniref:TRAP transporter substrate-binding protein DctP n=1 Tax=Halalkalibacillus halophilus TaxID=392827 RepID=UPI000422AAD2|nr:TRAP transporter substrate-binding protein DctP [Halalkalibacillus halophilus]
MSKGKFSLLIIAVSMLAVVMVACGDSDSGEEETIELRAATGLSAQHAWWDATMVPWMEQVEELTDGQVQFETFTGGELVDVPDEAEATLDGTIDVGLILPIYEPDQYPMAEVTMLPLADSDTLVATRAWDRLLTEDIDLGDGETYYDMQFSDFKLFPTSTTQEYSISTTGHAFETVDDVEGTSLRTPSRIHELYSDKTGINSVTMPAVEMYDALSRGSFEGSYYSIADWSGYGFQDLFEYTLTGINFGHFNAFIGMNQDTWEDLPENVQEAMTEAYEDVLISGGEEWLDRADEMVEYNESEGGEFVEFDSLDQEVQDHFNEGIEETWLEYAELLEEQGLPGTELIKVWRDLIIEEGGDVPEALKDLE